MDIKEKSPLLTRKRAPGKGKENKHSEVDGSKGIASFPAKSARLHMSVLSSPQMEQPRRYGGEDTIL
jgi:hypothetical protein